MKRGYRKLSRGAAGDFLVPREALKPIQSQNVVKQFSPQFPKQNLKEMIPWRQKI